MDLRGINSKLQMSVYYFNINGGLTAADLLNDLARDSSIKKVTNSALFKTELLAKLDHSADTKLDGFVKEKLLEALKALQTKLDEEFYGLQKIIPASDT